jgi:hypothetical protein
MHSKMAAARVSQAWRSAAPHPQRGSFGKNWTNQQSATGADRRRDGASLCAQDARDKCSVCAGDAFDLSTEAVPLSGYWANVFACQRRMINSNRSVDQTDGNLWPAAGELHHRRQSHQIQKDSTHRDPDCTRSHAGLPPLPLSAK